MKTESVTVTRGNIVAGVAELLDALEPADAIQIAQAAGRMSAFAALLCQAPPSNPFHKENLPPFASVRAKPPEPEQEREPPGNAPAPAEQAPPPGEWSEPPGLLLKVLAALERIPSVTWALARRLDLSKRDIDALVLRNMHLFQPVPNMRTPLELSEAGKARLKELRSRSAPETSGADSTRAAA